MPVQKMVRPARYPCGRVGYAALAHFPDRRWALCFNGFMLRCSTDLRIEHIEAIFPWLKQRLPGTGVSVIDRVPAFETASRTSAWRREKWGASSPSPQRT